MLTSGLFPLAHRVVGQINITPPEHEIELVHITRLFFKSKDPKTGRDRFSVWDYMLWDGKLTIDDQEIFDQAAEHFETRREAVAAYNLDNFDANDWDECGCGECTDASSSSK